MKHELQRILDDWDYSAGLAWYVQHVQGKFFLKELFAKKADAYNNQKLRQELTGILSTLSAPAVPVAAPQTPANKPKLQLPRAVADDLRLIKVVDQAAMSPEELQLDQEWKPMYKQAMYLRHKLDQDLPEEKRKELAFEILNLMDEVQEIWEKKDFLKRFGHLPDFESKGTASLTVVQKHTRIRTLRTYISKAKKGVLKSDKVPEWEHELHQLEKEVNG